MAPLDASLSQAFGQSSDPAGRDGAHEMVYGQHIHLCGVQGLFSGITLQQFLGCFSKRLSHVGFLHYSAMNRSCLEGHKLIRVSYVAPSSIKDYIRVPSSSVSAFVLKDEWDLSSPARKVLQQPLFLFLLFFFYFFHMKCCSLQHYNSVALA